MAKMIVVYRLSPGYTAEAFESWISGLSGGPSNGVRRTDAFATEDGDYLEYVEVFQISDVAAFNASDMPVHVRACIVGDCDGCEDQPQIRISDEQH